MSPATCLFSMTIAVWWQRCRGRAPYGALAPGRFNASAASWFTAIWHQWRGLTARGAFARARFHGFRKGAIIAATAATTPGISAGNIRLRPDPRGRPRGSEIMRRSLIWTISLWLMAAGLVTGTAFAQPFPPNDAGVTMGHWHLNSRDVEANKKIFVALGRTPVTRGD